MANNDNIWARFEKADLDDTLDSIYEDTLGKPPAQQLDTKQKLLEIYSFYKALVDNMPGSVYWMNKQGEYLGCNLNMLNLLGYSSQSQLLGQSEYDFHALLKREEAVTQEILSDNKQIFETGQPIINKQENPFIDTSGKQWAQLTNKVPIKNRHGEVELLMGISLDISDRLALNDALTNATAQAQAANIAKTTFLENIRHDTRTPLVGILGCCDVILKTPDEPEKVVEHTSSIKAATGAFLHLMNRMLEVVRVTEGKTPNRDDRFDPKAPITYLVDLLRPAANEKAIKINLHLDDALPAVVCCNLDRFFKIVYEPVKNAITFTPDGGQVDIYVRNIKQTDGSLLIQIEIKDTGIGMSEEQKREIFSDFVRLSPSYRGLYTGLGAGLSIAKQFVNDLSGEIYIAQTDENKGTTVRINLPLKCPLTDDREGLTSDFSFLHEPMDTQLLSRQTTEKIEAIMGEDSRVLIVEDQPMAAKAAHSILNDLGISADIAPDGKTGVKMAKTGQYDFIFMDIGLPDFDGFEATRQIREHEKQTNSKHTPIVALSAHVDVESKQQCFEHGMDAVLSKPLKSGTAADLLQAFIPRANKVDTASVGTTLENTDRFEIQGDSIDLTLAASLVGDDENLAREVLDMFADSLKEECLLIDRAYTQHDWETVRKLVHKMKGATCYCGTERLKLACTYLEKAIRADETDLYERLYEQFLAEIEKFKQAYQALD